MALCRIQRAGGDEPQWVIRRDGALHAVRNDHVEHVLAGSSASGLVDVDAERSIDLPGDGSLDGPPGTWPAWYVTPVTERMEIWAAGVTYESSKLARMSESAEGGDFYARVYGAERPELFFKATPSRTVGPNAEVRIRADSRWNVPEPELAAVVAANGRILGYTIGNDMSSRDIEGANPLYLPQAKVYRGSCALGPEIVPSEQLDPANMAIRLSITRQGIEAFVGETSTSRMRRTVEELVSWLFRENDFPHGVVLLTGTGIIPPDEFSLRAGDAVAITIEGIGTLRNTVAA